MLTIRAFRAIDDEATCRRFMECHARVLTDYGITSISTNNSTWMHSPSVYGVVVENEDGEMVGGARLHLTSKTEMLPVESAIGQQHPEISDIIYLCPIGTAGEACGFWSARKVANLGVSVLLAKTIAAICSQVAVRSVFCFCGRHTSYIAKLMGSALEESVGDKGAFAYPTPQFHSYFFHNPDIIDLPLADETNRQRILDLRLRPNQKSVETITKHPVEILYNLEIPNIRLCNNNPVMAKVPGIFSTQRTVSTAL